MRAALAACIAQFGARQLYFLSPSINLCALHVLTRVMSTGSPWGAGTFAAGDGSRQPSALELEIAQIQGKSFWETVSKVKF